MRILESSDAKVREKEKIDRANLGCNKCPRCGKKVKSIVGRSWSEGLFITKDYQVNSYKCSACGCEYESEPYEI